MFKYLILIISSFLIVSCTDNVTSKEQSNSQSFWGKDSVWYTQSMAPYPMQLVFQKSLYKITIRFQNPDTINFWNIVYPSDTTILQSMEIACAIETMVADTALKMQVSTASMITLRQYDKRKYADYYYRSNGGQTDDSCYLYRVRFNPIEAR